MDGKTIEVLTPSYTYDENKNEVVSWSSQTVDDVLIAPRDAADIEEDDRTHGTRARIRLGFPKTFSGPLRGCRIVCPPPFEGAYDVVGDPRPNIMENCPTRWWYTADAEAVNG